MATKILKWLMAALAVFVGLYPFMYFFVDRKFGLLQSKSETLLADVFWNTGFYTHIILGGIALLIGWIQFSEKFRTNRLSWHRTIGKVYVVTALISAMAGIFIALSATGGIVATLGFMSLGLFWFFSTFKAYTSIRNMKIDAHQKWMIYSYAACLAAVTLRIYLPLLIMAFGDFTPAYLLVAWLCWVPNLIVAFVIIKRMEKRKAVANLIAVTSTTSDQASSVQ